MSTVPSLLHSRIFAALLAGFLAASAALPVAAQVSRGTAASPATVAFTGAVFSDAGQPLPGATVSVSGKAGTTVTTNSEGFFLVSVPVGVPVRFLVAFPGHAPQEVELRSPEAEKNLVVTLARQPAKTKKSGRSYPKNKRN
ncbi:carboxypeptidase-like regulatory domain-containing protein [Hymenobacter sp. HSC-4F20]|uniref:carboxypeptidase-like regulatory domain-containing protein n=1 Tax=Hymenobacter sp. HSC-4F20 TaxID=2864135 RepID=UPI001C7320C1|nr:carboxypeptidase-like regulatory domain-containing protein [Hymenobacter sp. HSC-4F20]